MISDTLADALSDMREYLTNPEHREWYTGELRVEIEDVMRRMDALRDKLDRPPAHTETRAEAEQSDAAFNDAEAEKD